MRKAGDSPMATVTGGRFERRATSCWSCAPPTRSATMRFTRWRKSWTGSRWEPTTAKTSPKPSGVSLQAYYRPAPLSRPKITVDCFGHQYCFSAYGPLVFIRGALTSRTPLLARLRNVCLSAERHQRIDARDPSRRQVAGNEGHQHEEHGGGGKGDGIERAEAREKRRQRERDEPRG